MSCVDKPWDAEYDCEYLRAAMKGMGTNDDAVIHVVTSRCNQQREELKAIFKTLYGRVSVYKMIWGPPILKIHYIDPSINYFTP